MSKPQVTITLGRSGQRVVKNSRSDTRADYQAESGRKRSVSDRFEKDDDTFMPSSSKRVDIDEFKGIFRLQRTDYPRSAGSSTIGKGAQIGQNDLRLKLLRKRTTRQVKHEVQEHTKREIRHISSSAMVSKVTEQTFKPSTMPRIIRRRSNNDVLAPSIPIHSMPISRGATFDADKRSTGHLSGGQCLTVSSLLNSLGLGKYAINFQAEEVDMTVMKQMRDQDLKALGLPMGPRKKILLAIMPRPKRQLQLQA